MKSAILLVSCFISSAVFAQNVYVAEEVKSQPLVYRDKNGGYYGCGIRSIFVTNVPKPTHVGDISVNIFRQDSGNIVGLVKIMYSKIANLKDVNSTTNLPLARFMFADSSGKALRLGEIKSGEVSNTYLAQSSAGDGIDYIFDAVAGKTTEVGVTFKGNDSSMRVFSLKNLPLTKDEAVPLNLCIKQLSSISSK